VSSRLCKDSNFYPGIARDAVGTVDPNNPKTLIVETHPQPWARAITVYIPAIRIWMQVGDRDLFNPNVMRDDMHDWVVANHRMAAALKDKGYQYQYVFALDSGHCDRRVREQTLPQALEWTWRGYKPARH
jgi:hypothetical protein